MFIIYTNSMPKKSINQNGGINFTGRNYYSVIGVKQNDSDKIIKKAYRKKALKIHPDRHPKEIEKYEPIFKELQHAYEVLKEYRQPYDNYINYPGRFPPHYKTKESAYEKTPQKPKPKSKTPPKPKKKSPPKPKTPPKSKRKSPPKKKSPPKPKPKSPPKKKTPPKSRPKPKSPPKTR